MLLTLAGFVGSPAEDKLQSGPQPKSALPGSFVPLNINGEGKGRPRCLVTLFGHDPVAMVFAITIPMAAMTAAIIVPEVAQL